MDTAPKKSLMQLHPGRVDILILIVSAIILLGAGLYLPVLTIKSLTIFKDTFSIVYGIHILFTQKHYALAVIVFVFSIVFPISKLAGLLFVWLVPTRERQRLYILRALQFLGKWSMMDVFIVAITIVAAKLSGFMDADARVGVYVFGFAVFLSMCATMLVGRLTQSKK